jgi:cytochrome oxidase Cu insertion factor (SCO1/SenC/PrrC family)
LTVTKRQQTTWAAIVAALVILAAAAWFSVPGGRAGGGGNAEDTASPLQSLEDLGAVPQFALVSQRGDTVRLPDLAGRVWIADFIFTRCTSTCPMMTERMLDLEDALADVSRLRFVSISVDPVYDTPERLAEFAASYGADTERWYFLTGEKAAIRSLSVDGFHLGMEEASAADKAAGAESVMHSTRFVLVDGRGHIRGYYNGISPDDMKKLQKDVRRLASSTRS